MTYDGIFGRVLDASTADMTWCNSFFNFSLKSFLPSPLQSTTSILNSKIHTIVATYTQHSCIPYHSRPGSPPLHVSKPVKR